MSELWDSVSGTWESLLPYKTDSNWSTFLTPPEIMVRNGTVFLRGTVTRKDGIADGYAAFTIPEKYRPSQITYFNGAASGSAIAKCEVTPAGVIKLDHFNGGTSAWIGLDNVYWFA
jgi:hypothetical protein